MANLYKVIEDSFIGYGGAVLQNRALVDVRDGLKPSARQIFYSMQLNKLTSDKPYKKTANAVGMAMADFYIHGDSSCEGVIMRAGQPFAMRYPLVDVKGNCGSLIESGNYAAMRYTESRLSKLSDVLFEDIDKDTIEEWRDSYDNTKQYPAVLPTKGFYNICNGSMGIGIGMACSIPQYNLREMNKALEHLLLNPNCDFNDIYITPDFATGAVLLNENEVKESMKNGNGFACKLRSVVEYDKKENCFIVTEIPYSVYTNTICSELEQIIEGNENPGVDRFNDLTGKTPLIKIYLTKQANPNKVLKYLYKNTSLQSYYSINFTMLDKGRFPKLFTWKEMLQAHIDHEKVIYRRGFEYDLKKIENRIHIIEGLLKAYDAIDEVVHLIKAAASSTIASKELQSFLEIDEVQAKAILALKLSSLSKLDITKLINEKDDLNRQATHIKEILTSEELFNDQLIKGWRDVAKKFGDERRTKILNLGSEEEPTEIKQLQISLTNKDNIYAIESSSLYTQKRGGVGAKAKLDKDEIVIDSITAASTDTILFFMKNGNYYSCSIGEIDLETKIPVCTLIGMKDWERVGAIANLSRNNTKKYVLFVTKNGILKKSRLDEYNTSRRGGAIAIKLDDDDRIVSVLLCDEENLGVMTQSGNFLMTKTDDVRAIGRVARGIRLIKLNEGDIVVAAKLVRSNAKELISISRNGYIKSSNVSEFSLQGKNTKGSKIQKLYDGDVMTDFLPVHDLNEIIVVATKTVIKFKKDEVPTVLKGTYGVRSMKIAENNNVITLN